MTGKSPPGAIFVTTNEHKLREAEEILAVKLKPADLDLPEIQTLDFSAVVTAKARAARAALGSPKSPVFVDDSGLVVEAWGEFPGALTKWMMMSVGNTGLLRMLSDFEDRSARAVCAVAVVDESGETHVFRGEVAGEIADEPRGEGGFGFDPVFIPEGSSLTYAEMGEEKNTDSHRTRAFRRAGKWLESL